MLYVITLLQLLSTFGLYMAKEDLNFGVSPPQLSLTFVDLNKLQEEASTGYIATVNACISGKVNNLSKLFPSGKNGKTPYANNLAMNQLANEIRPCWSCEMTQVFAIYSI